MKYFEGLIQQFTMLRRDKYVAVDSLLTGIQGLNYRGHFNRFRPRSHHTHDFFP
jgi:hypothetical protein